MAPTMVMPAVVEIVDHIHRLESRIVELEAENARLALRAESEFERGWLESTRDRLLLDREQAAGADERRNGFRVIKGGAERELVIA